MQVGFRLKEKNFWLAFALQALVVFGLFWWLGRDIFYLTFQNAQIEPNMGLILSAMIGGLLPIFISQILVANYAPKMLPWKFWGLIVLSVFWGLGLAIILADAFTKKYFSSNGKLLKLVISGISLVVFWWLIYQIGSLISFSAYLLVIR